MTQLTHHTAAEPAAESATGPAPGPDGTRYTYTVSLARSAREVQEAQRLRHLVFAQELGARLDSPLTGLDADGFDAHCDHLIVRCAETGEVAGTYRLLPPGRSDRLYSETEFDLSGLGAARGVIRGDLVEAGRTCVHPGHRGGAVMGLLWAGIARYMVDGGHGYLAGCCSVPLDDGGRTAAGVLDNVRPGPYRVEPLRPWDAAGAPRPERFTLPPLLRGYLRLGATICGRPAYDPDFRTADFFVLLPMADADRRYLRHFLGGAA
jgi:putative hemolysin